MQSLGVASRRRRRRSSATAKGLRLSPLFSSTSWLGLLQLLLLPVLLLLLQLLALSPASALLQFAEVPNRTTNERTATFTFDCTALDVAQGDTCEVEVRVRARQGIRFLSSSSTLEYLLFMRDRIVLLLYLVSYLVPGV